MSFGDRLRELLSQRGMTVAELARLTGISKNTLYSYLRRNTLKYDPAVLQKLSDALDVDIYCFLSPDSPSEDDEQSLWELRETLRRRPEMRTLFSVSKSATPNQIKQTISINEALKQSNEDNDNA